MGVITVGAKMITVGDVIKAAEEDGFEHTQGQWFDMSSTWGEPVTKACILGQVALNLQINHYDLQYGLNRIINSDKKQIEAGSRIINYNDKETKNGYRSYKSVLSYMKKILDPYKDQSFFASTKQQRAIRKDGTKVGF